VEELKQVADDVVALYVTDAFGSIGSFYSRFDQVSDEEVVEILKSAHVSLA
jgi:predicted phosphoribosyltransferase